METTTKTRGRKAKFVGVLAAKIAGLIKQHGITKTREVLMTEGVQLAAGKPKQKMTVSLPTLVKIGQQHDVKVRKGREPKFVGVLAKKIAGVIREHGLTYGREVLMTEGVQLAAGKPKQKLTVSLPTLCKIAKENNIKLKRGRRAAE